MMSRQDLQVEYDERAGIAEYDGAKASCDAARSSMIRSICRAVASLSHSAILPMRRLCDLDVAQAHHFATQPANGIAGSLTKMKEAAN